MASFLIKRVPIICAGCFSGIVVLLDCLFFCGTLKRSENLGVFKEHHGRHRRPF